MPWVGEDHEPSVAVHVDEARSHDPRRDVQAPPHVLGFHIRRPFATGELSDETEDKLSRCRA